MPNPPRKVVFDAPTPTTEEGWRQYLVQHPEAQADYSRWQALGGESPIELPEDFKAPEGGPKQLGSVQEMYGYLKSILPKAQANYGDGTKESYLAEKARLERLANSSEVDENTRNKGKALLSDLNEHYKDNALEWMAQDLRNAPDQETANRISAEMDSLRQVEPGQGERQRIASIMSGGTGWDQMGGDQVDWTDPNVGSMASQFTGPMVDEWNRQNLNEKYDDVSKQLLENAKVNKQQQLGYFDQGTNRLLSGLDSSNAAADQATRDAISKLAASGQGTKEQIDALLGRLTQKQGEVDQSAQDSNAQLRDSFGTFKDDRSAAMSKYLDSLSPLEKELTTKGYDPTSTSKEDLQRLLDSYGQLENQTAHGADQLQGVFGRYQEMADTQGMTAKERALLEIANRNAAESMRAQQRSLATTLRGQGNLSGDALMGQAGTAASSIGSMRSSAALQALASAQDRQERGIAGMAGTGKAIADVRGQAAANQMSGASQIRTGNDAMRQFNTQQQGITQRHQEDYAQQEALRRQKLAQDRTNTQLTKSQGDLEGSALMDRQTQDYLDRTFGRQTQTTQQGLAGAQNKYAIDDSLTGKTIGAADSTAERAARATDAGLKVTDAKTQLIGSTADKEDAAIKEWLALQAEKANLKNLGVKV